MKVIKTGDLSLTKKIKRFNCNECGCVFEAEKGEYVDQSNQRDGTMFSCKCPTCGRTCWDYNR